MSTEAAISEALGEGHPVVVIEAPAGTGKTFQGAKCADRIGKAPGRGRVLVLTHTHAAAGVFSSRTAVSKSAVEVRTIDSLIHEVAAAYHSALGLPPDPAVWARTTQDGYARVAARVASLLGSVPMVARAIARRYPHVICDEHQDATEVQESVVLRLLEAGSKVRLFGDPMQGIYESGEAATERWDRLKERADFFAQLDLPRRWMPAHRELGDWILAARERLRFGGQIELGSQLPSGVTVIRADDHSHSYTGYRLSTAEARPVRRLVQGSGALLVLAYQNATVHALRSFFFRSVPIWEGHTRYELTQLVEDLKSADGDATLVCRATVRFVQALATGFSPSSYGDRLISEVESGCSKKTRGKPEILRRLGRHILEEPSYVGASNLLEELWELVRSDASWEVKIDYPTEYWDAIRLGRFDDPDEGLSELAHRRAYSRPAVPATAISTIHKAKGLESAGVLILPCDRNQFPDSMRARCALYVAISRARESLVLVVPRRDPSPLLAL